MAIKLNAGEVGRSDLYAFSPECIVVDEKLNGRIDPHEEVAITALVKSFETEGQLQPVQVRRVEDNKVELVLGYRRHAACRKYNELHPDTPIKLKAVIVNVTEEDAFRRNIIENRERKACTPLDDAVNQRRLRDLYNWTDVKIAQFYRVTPPYIGLLKKLLTLPEETQLLVHNRKLALQAAVSLADLTPEEQQAVIAEAEGEGGNLSSAVASKTRNALIAKDEGKAKARSLAEVRKFLETLNKKEDATEAVKRITSDFLRFIAGRLTDKTMEEKIEESFH